MGWGQHTTNNIIKNNNKRMRGAQEKKRKNEAGKEGGYLRQHLAVVSLTEKGKRGDNLYTGEERGLGRALLSQPEGVGQAARPTK